MGFRCGIVGLPNVGKSTLFNALTSTQAAQAANYPFCTIEPNTGLVAVPDSRLDQLAHMAGSEKIIHTQIAFVDIAGLVRGASKGEGLGNQFLGHIREVDAIIHVLRCFEDSDITHVEGRVDPVSDAEVVDIELILSDLESVEKRITSLEKKVRTGDKTAIEQHGLLKKLQPLLAEGKPARCLIQQDPSYASALQSLQLITSKPVLYVANVKEEDAATGNRYSEQVAKMASEQGAFSVVISSKIEEEISTLEDPEEKRSFLADLGLKETGLSQIITKGYQLLGLQTYFTVGPKEARAWTILKGTSAPGAAGVIHTDFEKGFIRAETISFADYAAYKGEQACKEAGKMRLEGKEYIVQDGDVMHFRFNV
jgi:GTP-binding protein YchF